MKKIIFLIVPAFLIAVGAFFIFQYITNASQQKGALQVTSSPDSKVYLNDRYVGQTPLCECDNGAMLSAGDYTIRLVPVDSSLSEFQDKVTISEGVLTVVDRKFGKDSLSEGSIISLSPLPDKKDAQLLVVSFPEGTKVWLDDDAIGTAPLVYQHPTESDHLVRISKSGYSDKTVRIRTPMGYKLTVAVYLSALTDTVTPTPSTNVGSTPTPSVSTVSPTPLAGVKVLILNTPTGFLRVRDTPSIDAAEVGQVNPGQKFSFISQQDGWLEIQLSDATKGWVSSQYAIVLQNK